MAISNREVLLAFYRATGGDKWIRNDGWGTGNDISLWYGVKVRDGRVVELRLRENNLQGPIPKELGQLISLEYLDLASNNLADYMPIELGQLSNLQSLDISNNQLKGSIPRELRQLPFLGRIYLGGNMLDVESNDIWIAKETQMGKDRLDYERYAAALAGLFRTGELDNLPTAIGIYAPWGGGKVIGMSVLSEWLHRVGINESFLLRLLQMELQKKIDEDGTKRQDDRTPLKRYQCMSTILLTIWRSALVVILRVTLASLLTWLRNAFYPDSGVGWHRRDIETPYGDGNGPPGYRGFIFVEFNAWECAGSEILWASLITKIFDKVEGHGQFGRGLVRATRLRKLLVGREWNWCNIVTFYLVVTVLGVTVMIQINVTGLVAEKIAVGQWATVVVGLPGILTFLRVFSQLWVTGFFRTAQVALQDAASKRESVGASNRGFMSEVKEELEILFEVINKQNKDRSKRENAYTLAVIIDDLDRCPKQQIVDMLRATHLLLEQPRAPMVVFLAVDPRLIVSAIAEVLGKEPGEVTGLEYLDKIIHIPFCLPRISKRERSNYLGALLDGDDNSCTKTLRRLERHSNMPSAEMKDVELTLKEIEPKSRSIIRRIKDGPGLLDVVNSWGERELLAGAFKEIEPKSRSTIRRIKDGPELLDVVNRWGERELLAGAFQRFKSKVNDFMSVQECDKNFEELNREVNQLVFKRCGGTVEGPKPNEQKDSVEGGETSLEGQNTSQHGRQATPLQIETSVGPGGQSSGIASPEFPLAKAISQLRKQLPIRTISTDEKEAFEKIFDFINATPRKMKRVVNVYVLQRYLFLGAFEQRAVSVDEEKDLRRALVTWTTLAEFWPMRLSSVVHEMEASLNSGDRTIVDFYGDEADEISGACALIHGILDKENTKTLFFSDAPEESFRMVVKHGETISKSLVLRPGGLLEHSFNLNPTIMTLVENIKRTRMRERNTSKGVEEKKGR